MKQENPIALYYFKTIVKDLDALESVDIKKYYQTCVKLCEEAIKSEKLQFSNTYSLFTYVTQSYKLSKFTRHLLFDFRRDFQASFYGKIEITPKHKMKALATNYYLLTEIYNTNNATIERNIPSKESFFPTSSESIKFISQMHFVAQKLDEKNGFLFGINADGESIKVAYKDTSQNEDYAGWIKELGETLHLPLQISLLDVKMDKKCVFYPSIFIVEPDYLIDVTSVSECFSGQQVLTYMPLLKKMTAFSSSVPVLIGFIANYFLDELLKNPKASFKEVFPQVFIQNPIAFCVYSNNEVRDIMQKSQKHFVHIKDVIHSIFPKMGVDHAKALLEPSFYGAKIGIQGRLDFLYIDAKSNEAYNIELKSGKPYRANRYGVNQSHYVQTLLYDLMIRTNSRYLIKPANYVLYSQLDQDNLKYAPPIKSQQFEALNARNNIYIEELKLIQQYKDRDTSFSIFEDIYKGMGAHAKGFVKRDVSAFEKIFQSLDTFERKYFAWFTGFIAEEHRLAKIGGDNHFSDRSQSTLWRHSFKEKVDTFNIIYQLNVDVVNTSVKSTVLELSSKNAIVSNFRVGDIVVLYKYFKGRKPTENQLYKCSILAIDAFSLKVQLRNAQPNASQFQGHSSWAIEPDFLDSGYRKLFAHLPTLFGGDKIKKDLFLGKIAPRPPLTEIYELPDMMTPWQKDVCTKAINAQDYFLLWGPPGTGKTSVLLRSIVDHFFNKESGDIMLLAYTNKAVDEICSSLSDLEGLDFIRIGSKANTAPPFQSNLLSSKIETAQSRQQVLGILKSHRVFVGTISSINNQKELFKIKSFKWGIVDEASQLLDPMVAGIFNAFEKIIFIGDHLQLPAISLQDRKLSNIEDTSFRDLSIFNFADSFFERLMRRCQNQKWTHAFALLKEQGRMHQDIMHFTSHHFYNDQLTTIPNNLSQAVKLNTPDVGNNILFQKRVHFIDSPLAHPVFTKAIESEADIVAKTIAAFKAQPQFDDDSIGVITPYRAQIALIKSKVKDPSIHIDTVERYQGSAKDIIIISLCVGHKSQLDMLVSETEEGVDRKLNVALTRARKHLVVIGQADVLRNNKNYKQFIDKYADVYADKLH